MASELEALKLENLNLRLQLLVTEFNAVKAERDALAAKLNASNGASGETPKIEPKIGLSRGLVAASKK